MTYLESWRGATAATKRMGFSIAVLMISLLGIGIQLGTLRTIERMERESRRFDAMRERGFLLSDRQAAMDEARQRAIRALRRASLETVAPEEDTFDWAQRLVDIAAVRSGVKVDLITLAQDVAPPWLEDMSLYRGFRPFAVRATVVGSFAQISAFVGALEAENPCTSVVGLSTLDRKAETASRRVQILVEWPQWDTERSGGRLSQLLEL